MSDDARIESWDMADGPSWSVLVLDVRHPAIARQLERRQGDWRPLRSGMMPSARRIRLRRLVEGGAPDVLDVRDGDRVVLIYQRAKTHDPDGDPIDEFCDPLELVPLTVDKNRQLDRDPAWSVRRAIEERLDPGPPVFITWPAQERFTRVLDGEPPHWHTPLRWGRDPRSTRDGDDG